MRKKWMSQILAGALVISAIAPMTVSASEDAAASDEPVTISFYTTVPDHDADFEKMCADFMEEHPNITVNYIAYDSSEKQKWMTLYASGEAPTVSLMDPIDIQENIANMAAYDPSTETWIDQLEDAYLDCFRSEDGQLYGVPNSVQAMGIIYNKTTIEKATGEEFDPSTITSSADLEALCEKIQADGKVGSTYAFSMLLPSDFWSENGAVMQQYLAGQMDRDAAADAIQAYWQAQ